MTDKVKKSAGLFLLVNELQISSLKCYENIAILIPHPIEWDVYVSDVSNILNKTLFELCGIFQFFRVAIFCANQILHCSPLFGLNTGNQHDVLVGRLILYYLK